MPQLRKKEFKGGINRHSYFFLLKDCGGDPHSTPRFYKIKEEKGHLQKLTKSSQAQKEDRRSPLNRSN